MQTGVLVCATAWACVGLYVCRVVERRLAMERQRMYLMAGVRVVRAIAGRWREEHD